MADDLASGGEELARRRDQYERDYLDDTEDLIKKVRTDIDTVRSSVQTALSDTNSPDFDEGAAHRILDDAREAMDEIENSLDAVKKGLSAAETDLISKQLAALAKDLGDTVASIPEAQVGIDAQLRNGDAPAETVGIPVSLLPKAVQLARESGASITDQFALERTEHLRIPPAMIADSRNLRRLASAADALHFKYRLHPGTNTMVDSTGLHIVTTNYYDKDDEYGLLLHCYVLIKAAYAKPSQPIQVMLTIRVADYLLLQPTEKGIYGDEPLNARPLDTTITLKELMPDDLSPIRDRSMDR